MGIKLETSWSSRNLYSIQMIPTNLDATEGTLLLHEWSIIVSIKVKQIVERHSEYGQLCASNCHKKIMCK